MALLKDAHPTIAEILEGKHDDLLPAFVQAVEARRKAKAAESGIRKGALIQIVASNTKIGGRTGIVKSVNKQTLTVWLDCPACGKHDYDERSEAKMEAMSQEALVSFMEAKCQTCYDVPDEWRVSPSYVELRQPVAA